MTDKKIRIKTSVKGLEDKIVSNIEAGSDTVYWYIKFNILLDGSTINKKTMNVTDTDYYIMKTNITYEIEKNLIIISPIDSYEQNRFYILNISKKVKSAKGNNLKRDIHILFKLLEDQISEYKVLDSTVKPQPPRPRPHDYDKTNTRSKIYSFDKKMEQNVTSDKLPYANMKINILLGLLGFFSIIISIILKNHIFSIVSIIISIVGIWHILFQFSKKELRSVVVYNKGVLYFNRTNYKKAKIAFARAFVLDENNELCEYAISKVDYY